LILKAEYMKVWQTTHNLYLGILKGIRLRRMARREPIGIGVAMDSTEQRWRGSRMSNIYREMQQIAERHSLTIEDVYHALLASVHSACCQNCAETIQSEAFLASFEKMAEEFQICKRLSGNIAA